MRDRGHRISEAQMEARGATANRLKTWTCESLTARDGEAVKRASVSLSVREMASKGQERRRQSRHEPTDHMFSSPGEKVLKPYVVKSGF